jgi:hypothetical protein
MNEVVTSRGAAELRFSDWLHCGWAIGVFENKDLGSPHVGERFALPFSRNDMEFLKIGETRAPDTKTFGMGWRYILVDKPTTVGAASIAVFGAPQCLTEHLLVSTRDASTVAVPGADHAKG